MSPQPSPLTTWCRAAGRAQPRRPPHVLRRIARLSAGQAAGRAPRRHPPPPSRNQKITDPVRHCAGCAGLLVALFQSATGLSSDACVVTAFVAVHAVSPRRVHSATPTPERLQQTIRSGEMGLEECRPNKSILSARARSHGSTSTARRPLIVCTMQDTQPKKAAHHPKQADCLPKALTRIE